MYKESFTWQPNNDAVTTYQADVSGTISGLTLKGEAIPAVGTQELVADGLPYALICTVPVPWQTLVSWVINVKESKTMPKVAVSEALHGPCDTVSQYVPD